MFKHVVVSGIYYCFNMFLCIYYCSNTHVVVSGIYYCFKMFFQLYIIVLTCCCFRYILLFQHGDHHDLHLHVVGCYQFEQKRNITPCTPLAQNGNIQSYILISIKPRLLGFVPEQIHNKLEVSGDVNNK